MLQTMKRVIDIVRSLSPGGRRPFEFSRKSRKAGTSIFACMNTHDHRVQYILQPEGLKERGKHNWVR